jgi:hypothetical protein
MKIKTLNELVTGNWYIRNDRLYIEYKRFSPNAFGMNLVSFKYISEEKVTWPVNGPTN